MIFSRRAALAGGAALLAAPGLAQGETEPEARLRAALDSLPRLDPFARIEALGGFDPTALSLSPMLDLLTVRAGLSVDVMLSTRFPGVGRIGDVPAPAREAYYTMILRRRLGDVAVADARRRLQAALAALTARTDAALRSIGQREGKVGARLKALMADQRFHYADDDAGRDRAVADMNWTLARRRARMADAFDTVPAWCLDVAVSRPARADAPAGKRILPEPGKPGGYVVDLKDIKRRPSWTLGSVVAHELLPGHLVQLPIEAAGGMHPLRADYAAPFVEGWGVYAEQLAAAQGAFAGDALGLIGHLHWLLFRATRAIVDFGIHLDGWSDDRARAFFDEQLGPPAYFAPYDVELKRTRAEPSNRTADALAWLAIADLAPRNVRARKQFNARVLAGGRKRIEHLRQYVTTESLS